MSDFSNLSDSLMKGDDGGPRCKCGESIGLFLDRDGQKCPECLMKERDEYEVVLCNLLEWAKGNRGAKNINPYAVDEVNNALVFLAKKLNIKDKLDINTRGIAEREV